MTSAIDKAKSLRKSQTEAEKLVWHKIGNNQLGCKFSRQMPVGIYNVDFVCLDLKLIVEIDGGQHAENEKDVIRTKFLNSLGYKVIRFWNNEVLENIDGVIEAIFSEMKNT